MDFVMNSGTVGGLQTTSAGAGDRPARARPALRVLSGDCGDIRMRYSHAARDVTERAECLCRSVSANLMGRTGGVHGQYCAKSPGAEWARSPV